MYRCAGDDDWIALAVRDDADWHSLCRAINRPDLAADPRFADEAGRRASHDSLDEELTAWTHARSAEACVAEVQVQGVPAEVVIHPRDVAANEQLDHRQMFEVEHHPVTGDHAVPLLPFRLSGVDHWLRLPAPTLGQHNDEVLGSVGVDAARLAALRETGVIGDRPTGT